MVMMMSLSAARTAAAMMNNSCVYFEVRLCLCMSACVHDDGELASCCTDGGSDDE